MSQGDAPALGVCTIFLFCQSYRAVGLRLMVIS
jgi:hypothetical protein